MEALLESEAAGIQGLPMGWSWELLFVQELLQEEILTHGVPEFKAQPSRYIFIYI